MRRARSASAKEALIWVEIPVSTNYFHTLNELDYINDNSMDKSCYSVFVLLN